MPIFSNPHESYYTVSLYELDLYRLKNDSGMLFCRQSFYPNTNPVLGYKELHASAFWECFLFVTKSSRNLCSEALSSLSAPSNKWLIPAIKNQATGHYILNGKGEEVKSRSFIDLGVEWHYIIEGDMETLQTDGPLHDPVVVLVITLSYLSPSFMNSSKRLFTW